MGKDGWEAERDGRVRREGGESGKEKEGEGDKQHLLKRHSGN